MRPIATPNYQSSSCTAIWDLTGHLPGVATIYKVDSESECDQLDLRRQGWRLQDSQIKLASVKHIEIESESEGNQLNFCDIRKE